MPKLLWGVLILWCTFSCHNEVESFGLIWDWVSCGLLWTMVTFLFILPKLHLLNRLLVYLDHFRTSMKHYQLTQTRFFLNIYLLWLLCSGVGSSTGHCPFMGISTLAQAHPWAPILWQAVLPPCASPPIPLKMSPSVSFLLYLHVSPPVPPLGSPHMPFGHLAAPVLSWICLSRGTVCSSDQLRFWHRLGWLLSWLELWLDRIVHGLLPDKSLL